MSAEHESMIRSGIFFDVLNPRAEDIHIEDIAHALSNLCRFGGHSSEFYSVAEHSVICFFGVDEPFKKHALLHDASEAYLVDIPRPIKKILPEYQRIENNLQRVIFERFGLDANIPNEVHLIDRRLCITEAMALGMRPELWGDYGEVEPLNLTLCPMSPKAAKEVFLEVFKKCFG